MAVSNVLVALGKCFALLLLLVGLSFLDLLLSLLFLFLLIAQVFLYHDSAFEFLPGADGRFWQLNKLTLFQREELLRNEMAVGLEIDTFALTALFPHSFGVGLLSYLHTFAAKCGIPARHPFCGAHFVADYIVRLNVAVGRPARSLNLDFDIGSFNLLINFFDELQLICFSLDALGFDD